MCVEKLSGAGECFGSTFRPKPGWLECLQKLQDNIMLNNKLSQLSRGFQRLSGRSLVCFERLAKKQSTVLENCRVLACTREERVGAAAAAAAGGGGGRREERGERGERGEAV